MEMLEEYCILELSYFASKWRRPKLMSHYFVIFVSSILCMLHADLVILNSRVTPHDLDNLNAFVKPKLLEDSRDEGSK